MKTCLLSTVIVLLFVSMHAQQHVPVPLSREARHRQQIKDLIALSSAHTQQALKHRGNSRLVAMATNNIVTPAPPTYEPYDSTQYYYTGGYGYDPTSDLFSDYQIETPLYETYKNYFDMSKNWLYDMSMSSYSLYDSVGCLFTTNHKRTREHTKYFPFPGYFNTNYTYDAMERIDVQYDTTDYTGVGSPNIERYLRTYNANNKVKSYDWQFWKSSTMSWMPNSHDTLLYDASNRLILIKEWVYDTTLMVWTISDSITLTYNGTGTLQQIRFYEWNDVTTSWDNAYHTAFLYNGAGKTVSVVNSSWDGASWLYENKDSFTYASGPYPVQSTSYSWDALNTVWSPELHHAYTYNTSDQVTQDLLSAWNSGSSAWDLFQRTLYYYESYNPQSVPSLSNPSAALLLYPNPAHDQLFVKMPWSEAQSAEWRMVNLQGETVLQQQVAREKELRINIPLQGLPSGLYYFELVGEKERAVKAFRKD